MKITDTIKKLGAATILLLASSVGASADSIPPGPRTSDGCHNIGSEQVVLFAFPMKSYNTRDLRQNPEGLSDDVLSNLNRLDYDPYSCSRTEISGGSRYYTMNNFEKNPANSFVVGWSSTRGRFNYVVISACDNTYHQRPGYCIGGRGQAYTLVENDETWDRTWRNDGTNGYPIRVWFQNPNNVGNWSPSDIIYSIGIR